MLASEGLAREAGACTVQADFGTSDHAPVTATFGAGAGAGEGLDTAR